MWLGFINFLDGPKGNIKFQRKWLCTYADVSAVRRTVVRDVQKVADFANGSVKILLM